jgi:hypothetical protein
VETGGRYLPRIGSPAIEPGDTTRPKRSSGTGAARRRHCLWGQREHMHDRSECAYLDARQSMIRVWLTISAVWVAFWLITAAIVLSTADRFLSVHPSVFLLIVATPPILLLAVGAVSRWAFEVFALRARDQ